MDMISGVALWWRISGWWDRAKAGLALSALLLAGWGIYGRWRFAIGLVVGIWMTGAILWLDTQRLRTRMARPTEPDFVMTPPPMPHNWRECQPQAVALRNSNLLFNDEASQMQDAVGRVFADLSEHQREMFHEFHCAGESSAEHLAVMARVSYLLNAAFGDHPNE